MDEVGGVPAALEREKSEAGCSVRVFKVEKWWEGGMRERRGPERKMAVPASMPGRGRPAGRQGSDECINPFLSVPRPPTPWLRAPFQEWKLPFPLEGGWRSAPAKSGSSREGGGGEGTQARHYHFDCFDAIFGGGGVGRPFSTEHKDV